MPSLSSTSPFNTIDTPLKSPNSTRHHSRLLNPRSDDGIKEEREAAARSARQEVRAKVREDWEWSYIDGPPPASHPEPRLDPDTLWCERDSDSASPPSSPEIPPTPDPYKFESPDSLSAAILPSNRKRKRRHRLVAELSWNDGLRNFVRRRDAWTGGLTLPLPLENTDLAFLQSTPFTLPPSLRTLPSTYNPTTTSPLASSLLALTPLPPPLIPPTNSIRASITPLHYPAIYSKIVLQGTTPSIPINLADMTRALVGGWIADGEWLPKAAVVEAPVGKKKVKKMGLGDLFDGADRAGKEKGGRGLVKGAGRVKRFLGMGREGSGNGEVREEGH